MSTQVCNSQNVNSASQCRIPKHTRSSNTLDQAQVNSNHMDMRRGNPRSFSIYSGTLSQKKTELAASLCTTTEEESQRVDVSPQPVLKHATEFKTLEENIQGLCLVLGREINGLLKKS